MKTMRWAALAAIAALGLAACSDASADGEMTEVTVASMPNAFLAPLYVAMDDGIFEEHGLDVELIELQSGLDGVSAVVSGNAQYADIGLDDLAGLVDEGEESMVMMHSLVDRVTLTLVMDAETAAERGVDRDSTIEERYAALEGLNIGVTSPGAATDKYMQYYLREAGLEPDRDANLIAIGDGGSLLAALESNQIDAYHLSPPTPYVAEAEGFGTILIDGPAGDVETFSDFAYTGFAGNRAWAEENPEAAEAFTAALSEAMETVADDPAGVAEQMLAHLGSDDLEVTQQTLEAMLPALSEDGCFTAESVENSLAIMEETEILEFENDPAEGALWTNEFNGC